jgi:ribosomal protein L35
MVSKLKTHSWIAKRIKITKNNKFIHKKTRNNHLIINKWSSVDRFKMGKEVAPSDQKSVKTLLSYRLR